MAERIEFVSTPQGGEHTASTDNMKKDAWKAAEDLGIKDEAKMGYSPKTGVYVMTLSDNVPADKVASFVEATASHRTDEARAELATALPEIKAAAAAGRDQAPAEVAKETKEKAPAEPKPPRSNVAIYPLPVSEVAEGQTPQKAASSAMVTEAKKVIEDLGLSDSVKVSYNMQEHHWNAGGRGLSDDTVKALEDGLAAYRTPEAKQAWLDNAPVKTDAAKDTGSKGPSEAEGPDLAGAAKAAGAER